MIFYDCSTAPNPRRARMFIAEKGVEPERREISIARGEQLSDAFLEVNPRATVPVLVTDEGTVLCENGGIAAYLEARFPEPPLMGTTPEEKGLVQMWNDIAVFQGGLPIAEALRNGNPHMKGRAVTGPEDYAQIPELAKRGHARAQAFFASLDKHLSGQPYMAGSFFSYADITAFVMVDFARVIKLRVSEETPALLNWYGRIASRPSAQL